MPPSHTAPVSPDADRFYARPKVGDVFKRFTNPQRYQLGTVISMDVTQVAGNTPKDITETWVAVLVYGENEMWKFGWQTPHIKDEAHWQPTRAAQLVAAEADATEADATEGDEADAEPATRAIPVGDLEQVTPGVRRRRPALSV